ncbi:MAG: class I SAM-dependent methyltransferase [Gammaproteobacteria bacterium]|nr:class I SAM-dependent methyltransferase [Gammaproteobacteria bacterium]
MSKHSLDPWTSLWQAGAGSSCYDGSKAELHLTRIWDEHVDTLPDEARMIDLATGNGTVALICAARASAKKKQLKIDAVDSAGIDPAACLSDRKHLLSSIVFHDKTRLEALPFRDGTFHSVVSQFGFEYACEMRAAAEVARVLIPSGHLCLVIHAKSGAVARDIDLRLRRMHEVLAENGPVSLVLELIRAYEASDVSTIESKSQYLPAAMDLIKRFRQQPLGNDSALYYGYESLRLWSDRNKFQPQGLRLSIEDAWTKINDMAIRQELMLSAVRDRQDLERLQQQFSKLGLVSGNLEKVRDALGVQIAWRFDARKNA